MSFLMTFPSMGKQKPAVTRISRAAELYSLTLYSPASYLISVPAQDHRQTKLTVFFYVQ